MRRRGEKRRGQQKKAALTERTSCCTYTTAFTKGPNIYASHIVYGKPLGWAVAASPGVAKKGLITPRGGNRSPLGLPQQLKKKKRKK